MKEPRQTSIGITPKEKAQLDKAKDLYETKTGDKADWGKFLAITSIVALGVFGIYKMVQSNRDKPSVKCPNCGIILAIPQPYSGELPRSMQVKCPECSADVVIYFGS